MPDNRTPLPIKGENATGPAESEKKPISLSRNTKQTTPDTKSVSGKTEKPSPDVDPVPGKAELSLKTSQARLDALVEEMNRRNTELLSEDVEDAPFRDFSFTQERYLVRDDNRFAARDIAADPGVIERVEKRRKIKESTKLEILKRGPSVAHVYLTDIKGDTVTLCWEPPESGGGEIIRYEVSMNNSALWEDAGLETMYIFSTLLIGQTYLLAVRPVYTDNIIGYSKTILYPAGQPGPPTQLRLTPVSLADCTLSWQPPYVDGGSPIREYQITTDGENWISTELTSHTFQGDRHVLDNKYTICVRAVNDYGILGMQSGLAIAPAPPERPLPAPNPWYRFESPEDAYAIRIFFKPVLRYNKPIQLFEVWNSEDAEWHTFSDTTELRYDSRKGVASFLFTGLRPNTAYSFKIRGVNDLGAGEEISYTLDTRAILLPPRNLEAKFEWDYRYDGGVFGEKTAYVGEVRLKWQAAPISENLPAGRYFYVVRTSAGKRALCSQPNCTLRYTDKDFPGKEDLSASEKNAIISSQSCSVQTWLLPNNFFDSSGDFMSDIENLFDALGDPSIYIKSGFAYIEVPKAQLFTKPEPPPQPPPPEPPPPSDQPKTGMFGILCYNQKPINNVFKGLVSMLQITGVRAKITKVENPNLVKLIRLGNYQDILFSRLRVPPGETDLDPLSSTEHFNSITTDHGCAFLFAADPNIGEYWGYTTYLRLNIYWEEIK